MFLTQSSSDLKWCMTCDCRGVSPHLQSWQPPTFVTTTHQRAKKWEYANLRAEVSFSLCRQFRVRILLLLAVMTPSLHRRVFIFIKLLDVVTFIHCRLRFLVKIKYLNLKYLYFFGWIAVEVQNIFMSFVFSYLIIIEDSHLRNLTLALTLTGPPGLKTSKIQHKHFHNLEC